MTYFLRAIEVDPEFLALPVFLNRAFRHSATSLPSRTRPDQASVHRGGDFHPLPARYLRSIGANVMSVQSAGKYSSKSMGRCSVRLALIVAGGTPVLERSHPQTPPILQPWPKAHNVAPHMHRSAPDRGVQ